MQTKKLSDSRDEFMTALYKREVALDKIVVHLENEFNLQYTALNINPLEKARLIKKINNEVEDTRKVVDDLNAEKMEINNEIEAVQKENMELLKALWNVTGQRDGQLEVQDAIQACFSAMQDYKKQIYTTEE
eukprot:TRINITY_DN38970_c0_g1_i1.p3 TRINITY_DN38970_c0_g1~~TRINITY_DN38970_c0_g1_i1.p3  ORF type:complete len:144 (-),score=20.04 TRINITY_DN38970_c0_g1_i1:460-855(-)